MFSRFLKLPRNGQIWLPGYIRSLRRHKRQDRKNPCKRVWVVIADHYEPWSVERKREEPPGVVQRWRASWPQIAARHKDTMGRPPCYTFFFPEEQYRPDLVEPLAEMTRMNIADVEVHIHHGGEGEQEFRERMAVFTESLFRDHGLLRTHEGRIVFGFIHGNWALDNSRPDGKWCGLNNELILLRELGCYADFTLPSAPSPTQTQMVNTIYWATDNPAKAKSHDLGIPVAVGKESSGDLLLVPGPLGLRRHNTQPWIPRLEAGEIASYDLPSRSRVSTWLDCAPRLGDDIFVKLFTHGAQQRNADALLEGELDCCFEQLSAECAARGLELYYVSAWDMFRAIESVRKGEDPRALLSPPRVSVEVPS
jgi:hypothetical protein